MHGHNANGFFVGLRHRGLGYAGAFIGLPLHPFEEGAERVAARRSECARLLHEEPVAPPLLALARTAYGGFHEQAVSNEAVDECGGCSPHAPVVGIAQHFEGI